MSELHADAIRVVIVDDHEMLAESLVRLLSEDPSIVVVDTATTAEAGIDLVRAEHPDVVVMDFQLPDMNGADATRILKAHDPDVRVILLTGSDRPGAYYAATQAGVSAWMRKTMAVHDLCDAVHRVHEGDQVPNAETDELPPLDQLVVRYQPVIDLNDGRISGFEALVRWADPQRGVIPPDRFLPIAEQTGYIHAIDTHVAGVAARQLAVWQRQFSTSAPRWVSVNLSASGLNRPAILEELKAILVETGITPESLVLEITETVLLEDTEDNIVSLRRLKDVGLRLSLDDFGTAFSSLSYLRRFPFDVLKIDTSFTSELPESARTLLLVDSIHQLVSAIGLDGIAEGIERDDQAEALQRLGWELGQGYLYSRPVDSLECEALLLAQSEGDGSRS